MTPSSKRIPFVAALALVGSLLAADVQPAQALGPNWTLRTPATAPAGRYSHSMAYMPSAGATVMFGGCSQLLDEPSVRVNHRSKRDANDDHSHTDNVTYCSVTHGDTWSWNGSAWTQRATTGGPAPRYAANLAYDSASGALILTGGVRWEITDTPEPTPPDTSTRCMGTINYFEILSGTNTGKYLNLYCYNDTWSLTKSGTTWTWNQLTPSASPPARFEAAMAHDALGRPTLTAGCKGIGIFHTETGGYGIDCHHYSVTDHLYARDTWTFVSDPGAGGPTWQKAAQDHPDCGTAENRWIPTCRYGFPEGATFNPQNTGTVFLYGGFHYNGGAYNLQNFVLDTVWQWWHKPEPLGEWHKSCFQNEPDCGIDVAQGAGRRAWAAVETIWWEGAFRPAVFAGRGGLASNEGNKLNRDLWVWVDTPGTYLESPEAWKGSWVQACPSLSCTTQPSARWQAGMAYHAQNHLVVFGGMTDLNGTPNAQTWTFPAAAPPGSILCTACIST